MDDSKRIKLYLLGGVELRGIDRAAADRVLAQQKLTGLLAVLALSPDGRLQRRDRLVGLLWPELDQAHARTALRKGIHSIRAALGADALRTRGDEEVGLDRDRVWCDAADLVGAADEAMMVRVLELYQGELMPGFHLAGCLAFERWLEDERTVARERAAAAAWALATTMEANSQRTDAGLMARRAVRYAESDERVLRRTIAMLCRIGDHAGAVRLYEEFVERMRKELEAEPSPETVALVESLRLRPGRVG